MADGVAYGEPQIRSYIMHQASIQRVDTIMSVDPRAELRTKAFRLRVLQYQDSFITGLIIYDGFDMYAVLGIHLLFLG